jgi:proteasome lid subunit RPN8/RPN11
VSGDEITFGEMNLRQPERRHRPDHDRKFVALAYEVPGPDDLPIFLDSRAADAIERHALADTAVELGGILLGKECLDQSTGRPFVWITHSLEATHYANTQASFTYTHDSWAEITRQRDERYPQYDIVGWYHTHPSFGIFLSHHDMFIHQHFFAQPLQVAFVVDPINQTRGFFQWRDGGMAQVAGYFVTAPRADRVALARLVNDLERFPNSEGNSGGILSPRLEAELIKMLTRPAQRDIIQPVAGFQIATIFGLLGVFLGALGLAAALLLNQLHGRIREQGEKIDSMSRLVEQSSASHRLVSETLAEKGKIEDPAEFTSRYARVAADLGKALDRLESQRSLNEDLQTRKDSLDKELAAVKKSRDAYQKDADEAPGLRKLVAELEKTSALQKAELEELRPLGALPEGKEFLTVQRSLAIARLWAYLGWGCSLFLGLALGASYFYQKVAAGAEPDEAPEPSPAPVPRPTHRIE